MQIRIWNKEFKIGYVRHLCEEQITDTDKEEYTVSQTLDEL